MVGGLSYPDILRHPYHACVSSLLLQSAIGWGELRDFAFGCRCVSRGRIRILETEWAWWLVFSED
jgi:hypothetical protein